MGAVLTPRHGDVDIVMLLPSRRKQLPSVPPGKWLTNYYMVKCGAPGSGLSGSMPPRSKVGPRVQSDVHHDSLLCARGILESPLFCYTARYQSSHFVTIVRVHRA